MNPAGRHYSRLHRASARHGGIISITDDSGFGGQANRIDEALAGHRALASQHVRVNRPNPPANP
jgi:hypothetical protein